MASYRDLALSMAGQAVPTEPLSMMEMLRLRRQGRGGPGQYGGRMPGNIGNATNPMAQALRAAAAQASLEGPNYRGEPVSLGSAPSTMQRSPVGPAPASTGQFHTQVGGNMLGNKVNPGKDDGLGFSLGPRSMGMGTLQAAGTLGGALTGAPLGTLGMFADRAIATPANLRDIPTMQHVVTPERQLQALNEVRARKSMPALAALPGPRMAPVGAPPGAPVMAGSIRPGPQLASLGAVPGVGAAPLARAPMSVSVMQGDLRAAPSRGGQGGGGGMGSGGGGSMGGRGNSGRSGRGRESR